MCEEHIIWPLNDVDGPIWPVFTIDNSEKTP